MTCSELLGGARTDKLIAASIQWAKKNMRAYSHKKSQTSTVKSSSCFAAHCRTEEIIESAATSGDSPFVLVSRSHSASCPKKCPAGLEASKIPSVVLRLPI